MTPVSEQDPLGFGVPLPLEGAYFPQGFPLRLRTNSEQILAAACYGWEEFPPLFSTAPLELRVLVWGSGGDLPAEAAAGPEFRAQGHLLAIVLGPDNFAVCDLERGYGYACLSPGVARDPLYASFHFLDAMAYTCLTHRYTTPLHAACVAKDDRGILLVGPPGAGKSSLAWACARSGLRYVCDDAAWLLRYSEEPALVGKPQKIRFRPEVFSLLPELETLPRHETVAGKRSFEIRTADVPGFRTAFQCRPWRFVFLARRPEGPAQVVPVAPAEARGRLGRARPYWEPRVWAEQEASLDRLSGCEAVELRYSALSDAVEQILRLE